MAPSRRAFLGGAAALALAGPAAGAAAAARAGGRGIVSLHARPAVARIAPPGFPETPVWGYDGRTPGPTIRARQGQRVARRFVNGLPQPSTVHWHGIRIENAMDGVPGTTQAEVAPGDEFLYDFEPPDAGTYWYHPHVRTFEQTGRGLYGALVVEERDPPEVDREETLLIDDWLIAPDGGLRDGFGSLRDRSHAGRLGNWLTANGDSPWTGGAARFERLRLRLVNAANARIFSFVPKGLEGWTVALDGQPLAAPRPAGPFALAPGQRADLVVDAVAEEGEEAVLAAKTRQGDFPLAAFRVSGSARKRRLPAPARLPPNPTPALGDLARARRATLRMEGGAMGGMPRARLDGRMLEARDLAALGKVWAFNGLAETPERPLFAANAGETVLLEMVNDTAWPHGMHLHGHHFRAIAPGGAQGPLLDTFLVDRRETVRIAFVADNPGDWLLHCHMLEHADAGMTTWFRVA